MQERQVRIINRLGLHARAAARLVHLANTFRSQVRLARADTGQPADGKSILGVLLLAASYDTELIITTAGTDEQEALEAICQLILEKFGEHDGDRVY